MARPIIHRTIDEIKSRCSEEGDCWIWEGACDGHGKPQIRHDGRAVPTRRVVAELKRGKKVPSYLVVVAKCQNPLCVSPTCAHVTTHKGKARLASERGAYQSAAKTAKMVATKRAKSHITDAMVDDVRASQEPTSVIQQRTGISRSHIKMIRRYMTRKPANTPFAGLFSRMAA